MMMTMTTDSLHHHFLGCRAQRLMLGAEIESSAERVAVDTWSPAELFLQFATGEL